MSEQRHTTEQSTGPLIDAYCHIGVPKYGSLADVTRFFARLRIDKGILVLGPGIPDVGSLVAARQQLGDRVRVMGIPFGETEAQRRELGELQIAAGISGMRLGTDELPANRALIDRLGEEGCWLYAINPFTSEEAMRFLLHWLDRYPAGKVASPHCLRPQPLATTAADADLYRTLLKHPGYHAIFSRQAGVGSREPYPHADLRPWVEDVAELATWQRLLWGSEFPIFYQRNEQPETVRDWLLDLGIPVNAQERADFYGNNAQRLLFAVEPPPLALDAEGTEQMPKWVTEQIDRDATVYLFPPNPFYIPMADHGLLLTRYLTLAETTPALTYAEFIAQELSARVATILR